ncbi:MAG: archease [Pirellulales bacterium]
MFETFDHTADIGIRIEADSLAALLEEAGQALFSLIISDLGQVRDREEIRLRIDGTEPDYLLFDWLNELLYLFESKRLLASRFEVSIDEGGISGLVGGEPWDRQRHELDYEVKAITYHGLTVEQVGGRWRGKVIVDI